MLAQVPEQVQGLELALEPGQALEPELEMEQARAPGQVTALEPGLAQRVLLLEQGLASSARGRVHSAPARHWLPASGFCRLAMSWI